MILRGTDPDRHEFAKDELRARLNRIRDTGHECLVPETNPVAAALAAICPSFLLEIGKGSAAEIDPDLGFAEFQKPLREVVAEYSIFPRSIVRILQACRDRVTSELDALPDRSSAVASTIRAIVSELDRNIGQENGSETEGKSHYLMLISGLRAHGVYDLLGRPPSSATSAFLSSLESSVSSSDFLFALGAAYAIENTAVPELRIVRTVVERALCQAEPRECQRWAYVDRGATESGGGACGDAVAQQRRGVDELKVFFDSHLEDWEPSHECELLAAVFPLLNSDRDRESLFENGFRAVLEAMDQWWSSLAAMLDSTDVFVTRFLSRVVDIRERRVRGRLIPFEFQQGSVTSSLFAGALFSPGMLGDQESLPLLAVDLWRLPSTGEVCVSSAAIYQKTEAGDVVAAPITRTAGDERISISSEDAATGTRFRLAEWQEILREAFFEELAKRRRGVAVERVNQVTTYILNDPDRSEFISSVAAPVDRTRARVVTNPRDEQSEEAPKAVVQIVWLLYPIGAPQMTPPRLRLFENLLSETAAESQVARRLTSLKQAENFAHDVKNYMVRAGTFLATATRRSDPAEVKEQLVYSEAMVNLLASVALASRNAYALLQGNDVSKDAVALNEDVDWNDERTSVVALCAGELLIHVHSVTPENGGSTPIRRCRVDEVYRIDGSGIEFKAPESLKVVCQRLGVAIGHSGPLVNLDTDARAVRTMIDLFRQRVRAVMTLHLLREAIWNVRPSRSRPNDKVDIAIVREPSAVLDPLGSIRVAVLQRFVWRGEGEFDLSHKAESSIHSVNRMYGFTDQDSLGLGEILPPVFYAGDCAEDESGTVYIGRTSIVLKTTISDYSDRWIHAGTQAEGTRIK